MTEDGRLSHRVVLLSGERPDPEVARRLAGEGASLLVTGRAGTRVASIVEGVCRQGGQARALVMDRLGFSSSPPDLAIHQFSNETPELGATSPESWACEVDVHLALPFRLLHSLLPAMAQRGSGLIVFVQDEPDAVGGDLIGSAAHGMLPSITRSLAWMGSAHGVRCNAIVTSEGGAPAEVADAIINLMTEGRGMTGCVIHIGRQGQL